MAMNRFAGSYDAGVALIKMSILVTFLNNTAPYLRILRISDYKDPVKDLAVQMHKASRKKNIPSVLIIFADEGHGSDQKENRILEIGNTVEFFKKHLYSGKTK